MKVSEFLKECRKTVSAGWTQGTLYRDANGDQFVKRYEKGEAEPASCCAFGALCVNRDKLDHAKPQAEGAYQLQYKAEDYLLEALPPGWPSYIGFNDHPDTTKEMVEALFDKAAKLAEDAGE